MPNYIEQINKKYQLPVGIDIITKEKIFDPIKQHLKSWAYRNSYLLADVKLSGSRVKGTALSLIPDMDIFVYLSPSDSDSIRSIYNSLYVYFSTRASSFRRKTISIGMTFDGMNVDLIPGQKYGQVDGDHSLFKTKQEEWTQTNIDRHIRIVKTSKFIPEIVAAKIWRYRHNLFFPSIFLELVTMEALKNKGTTDRDKNFMSLLAFFKDNIQTVRIVDPANPNNVISEDFTSSEKKKIANVAKESLNKKFFKEILW